MTDPKEQGRRASSEDDSARGISGEHGTDETIDTSSGGPPRTRPQADVARSAAPHSIGPYEIISEIGRGGMGVVYKAVHPGLKRTVALKVLIAGEDASEESLTRFQREAEAVAKLGHHPNIVPIYDVGSAGGAGRGGVHYIAMHFVKGRSLDEVIDDERISPRQAAEITMKLARALQHAHEHGVLHRDVKPANVLMASQEEGNRGKAEGGGAAWANPCSRISGWPRTCRPTRA